MSTLRDIHGEEYDVTEARPTPMGWPVYIGSPVSRPSLRQVIVTAELRDYLRGHGKAAGLPIGATTVKRLRRALGASWWATHDEAWWRARAAELASMRGVDFAAQYGLSQGIVSRWSQRLGIERGSRSPIPPERVAVWVEQYRAGATLSEIAAQDGDVTSEGVRKLLLRAGVQMRARGGARRQASHPDMDGRAAGG